MTMIATVTTLSTRKLKAATFHGGLWSITRTIAGEEIIFKAEKKNELMDLVDMAVTKQLLAMAAESKAKKVSPQLRRLGGVALWCRFRTLFRMPPAVLFQRPLLARGRRDTAGATGVHPRFRRRDPEPRQRFPSP